MTPLAAIQFCDIAYLDTPRFELLGFRSRMFKSAHDVAFLLVGPRFNVLVFRGSDDLADLVSNLKRSLVSPGKAARLHIGSGERVHHGIHSDFAGIWPEIREHLQLLSGPVYYTGHSRGAALATLAARFLPPDRLVTFGSPRIGNKAFSAAVKCCVERFVHGGDLVTRLPKWGYVHVGGRRHLDAGRVVVSASLKGAPWRLFRGLADHSMVAYLEAVRDAYLLHRRR